MPIPRPLAWASRLVHHHKRHRFDLLRWEPSSTQFGHQRSDLGDREAGRRTKLLDVRFIRGNNGPMFTSITIDKLFDTVGECLTVDAASNLLRLSLPGTLQQQLDDWADRNSSGQLSDEERNQYEAILRTLNFIGVLQARARRIVAASSE